jgi:hypothetical protein
MKLALETYYGRRYESSTKNKPKKPLTKKERERLYEVLHKQCVAAYISRMTKSGLMSGVDSIHDLTGEAYIAIQNIMDKFDKARCGKIQKFDEEGSDKPKSLEFYFLTYFQGRVNWMAVDTRNEKKKRGMIGSQANSNEEVSYNPEDRSSSPEEAHRYDSIKFLKKALDNQTQSVKELFNEIYIEKLTTVELKKRHPDYLKLRRALGGFIKEFEFKNQELLEEEVYGYKPKKRGRRA